MNDISVKIVESPKAVEAPAPVENEVDPLAIDEEPKERKEAICDDNAKEEISETPNEDSDSIVTQSEKIKEALLKEDTCSLNSNTDEPENTQQDNEVEGKPETSPPPTEPEANAPETAIETAPSEVEAKKETQTETEDAASAAAPEPERKPSPVNLAVTTEVKEPELEKTVSDVEMTEVTVDKEAEKTQKTEPKPTMPPVNGDVAKEDQPNKRRASEDVDTDSPLKRLCQEVEKTFPQHDTMINDYIQTATKNNIDEIQRHTEQLLAEIQTLRELAQKKEHEWNNILHLKKVKEEILLRLLRRKQVLSFEKAADVNGAERTDPFDYLNQAKSLAIDKSDEISGLAIKQTGSTVNPMLQAPIMPVTTHFNPMSGLPPPYDKAAHMQNMPKPVFPQPMMMPGPMTGFPRNMADMNGQLPGSFGLPMGRQGPTKDVKSIIADYRQRNPEITPRRGRRMKSLLNPNMMNAPRPIAPKVDSMNNLSNLNMLFNNIDMHGNFFQNQKAMIERLQQIQAGGLPNSIFKDALVQFANMQQASAGLMPNRPVETITNRPEHHPKPETTRRRPDRHEESPSPAHQPHTHTHPPSQAHGHPHPAPHKQAERAPSSSPRLPPPPYPEISLLPVSTAGDTHAPHAHHNSLLHGILTKNCGEITITPVQPTPPPAEPQPEKPEEVVQLDDEESAASEGEASGSPAGSGSGGGGGSGRLVIDEAASEETPLCQGCRRRDAQFVCAGCANQWYCSRECQVAAWDEHSEMCSG